ncbi:MAG: hypothetical protein N2Z20_02825 [Elusimicrobiales bacterium]|nr:hypothetical protein [Elusimicrobiales bacterium]
MKKLLILLLLLFFINYLDAKIKITKDGKISEKVVMIEKKELKEAMKRAKSVKVKSNIRIRRIKEEEFNNCVLCEEKFKVDYLLGIYAVSGSFSPWDSNKLVLRYRIDGMINKNKLDANSYILITEYNIDTDKFNVVEIIEHKWPFKNWPDYYWNYKQNSYTLLIKKYNNNVLEDVKYKKILYGKNISNIISKPEQVDYSTSISDPENRIVIEKKSNQENKIYIKDKNGTKKQILNWGTDHRWLGNDNNLCFRYLIDYKDNRDFYSMPRNTRFNVMFYNIEKKEYRYLDFNNTIKNIESDNFSFMMTLSISNDRKKILYMFNDRGENFGILELKEPLN